MGAISVPKIVDSLVDERVRPRPRSAWTTTSSMSSPFCAFARAASSWAPRVKLNATM